MSRSTNCALTIDLKAFLKNKNAPKKITHMLTILKSMAHWLITYDGQANKNSPIKLSNNPVFT